LTKTDIEAFNQASTLLFTQIQFQSVAGPSALNGIISSTITPSISYNSVNSQVFPTGGKSYYLATPITGGILGGNVNSYSTIFEWKKFTPVYHKKNVLGFRFQTAYIGSYGGKEVPPYSRFYLGGEQDIRGFDIRSISPVSFIPTATSQAFTYLDPRYLSGSGQPQLRTFTVPILAYTITFPGGDIQTVGNFEYRIPIVGNYVGMDLFVDAGTVGILDRGGLQLDPTGLANLKQQFPGATINSQLPIASGTNFKLRMSTGVEFVVMLPIVQAPFRIYWAYNALRLHQQIVAPTDYIEPGLLSYLQQTLPKEVYQYQVAPTLGQFFQNPGRLNYFEPHNTFRFTVSRTF